MKIERQEVVWATALRTLDAQHRTSSWLRMVCVLTLWLVTLRCDPEDRLRVCLQLLPVTAGAVLAHVHARPSLLDRLTSLLALGRVKAHLEGTRGRAQVDLPGVVEGVGILIACTLYGSSWAINGLSDEEMVVALVAVIAFAWSVFLNVVLDPGFYAPQEKVDFGLEKSSGPPPRALTWLRHAVPPGTAALAAWLFLPDWTPSLAAVPLSLRCAFVLSFLCLRLVWLCFDQIMVAAAESAADLEQNAKAAEAGALHSVGKNTVGSALVALESPHYQRNEVRSLLRNTLVELEETIRASRGLTSKPSDGPPPVGELWEAAMALLSQQERLRCTLSPESHALILGDADRQLARRFISDLVTNALRAGAKHVTCTVQHRHDDPRRIKVEILVLDDGCGMPLDVLDRPATSLSITAKELRRRGGDITFVTPGPAGTGTQVRAYWRSATPVIPGPRSSDTPVVVHQKGN
ncbi:ATP-binding protein [Streptomyces cyaneofuscatus]|uniref:ATP-binding protein n=1 Tax=Streptomyces cyaneofuscatus TaxID=66883 RepID=UPI003816E4D7